MRNQAVNIAGLEGSILTIKKDQQSSGFVDLRRKGLRGLSVFSGTTLTGTVRMQTTANLDAENPSEVTWQDLQSGGANVTIGQSEAVPLDFVGWHGLRLFSDTAEGDDRVFKLLGVEDI